MKHKELKGALLSAIMVFGTSSILAAAPGRWVYDAGLRGPAANGRTELCYRRLHDPAAIHLVWP